MKCFSYNTFRYSDLPVTVRDTPQSEYTAPHIHDYIEIAMVRRGSGIHTQYLPDGEKISNTIIKGDIFTILPGEIHSYENCHNYRVYNICMRCDFLGKVRPQLNCLEYFDNFFSSARPGNLNQLHLPPAAFQDAENLLLKLRLLANSPRESREFAVQLTFLEFLLTVFDGGFKGLKSTGKGINERLLHSIARMEAHPEQKWELAQAAHDAGMSLSGYAHKFKDAVGVSPGEYSLLLKLDKARTLLETSELSLAEIALQCVLSDGNYLIKMFKKRFGMTPGKYRSMCRSRDE